jgi:hypothetical protein
MLVMNIYTITEFAIDKNDYFNPARHRKKICQQKYSS